jgi:hypothetical protein
MQKIFQSHSAFVFLHAAINYVTMIYCHADRLVECQLVGLANKRTPIKTSRPIKYLTIHYLYS